jgi:autotransporter-associated beta strand protein
MNPDSPQPSREEIEAKLTALLLGELPPEEAQLLRWAISQDAALAQLHDRLKATIGFVSEVAANPAETIPAQTAPLKLSDERREKLLAHFKTVAPKEFAPLVPPLKKRREISPLLAMAAAIALIAVLAAMLLPALASAKRKAQRVTMLSAAMEKEKPNAPAEVAPPATPLPAGSRGFPLLGPVGGGDNWQKQNQTPIVLPSDGTAGAELAAATPAPSANFNLGLAAGNPPRDQDVFTVHMDNADPSEAAPVLQKMFGSSDSPSPAAQTTAQANLARSDFASDNAQTVAAANRRNVAGGFVGSLGRRGGGAGGGGGGFAGGALLGPISATESASQIRALGDTPTAPIVAPPAADAAGFNFQFATGNKSAGELENQTISGAVAVNDTGAQTVDRTRSFYRNIAPDSAADKKSGVPVLGSIPVLGEAFRHNSENNSFGAAVDNNGNIVLADDLSKIGNVAMTLNGNNAYNGVTTIGGGTLNVPVSAANPLGAFPGNTTVNGGTLALNVEQEQADRVDTTTRLVQVEDGWQKSAAKDENHTLAYNNSGQINLGESVQQSEKGIVWSGTLADQNGGTLKKLEAPAAAPEAPLVSQIQMPAHRLPGGEIDSRAPVPKVAPPAPVTSATVVGYVNITNGIVLNQEAKAGLQAQSATAEDRPLPKSPSPAPIPTPEILTRENTFSTFSLNVSDVSFKLAAASLERGQLPDAASIRSEEFINAFDYRDPEPAAGVPVAFVSERARDPFAHNRDLLRFSIKTAAAGREAGHPLNIVLLLDNSGSMERADRVAIIHEALKVLASQLQPQDTLSIVTFARTARLWVDGARGDQAGTAVNQVSDLTPEGGTNLEEAMNLAYATARRHYLANGGNRVVLLTDGAANLGNVNPEALKQKVESFRKQGIALDCFGIGWEGYNDDLLEVLSSNGDGRYGFINTPQAATTEFAAQLAGALHVAAEDVKVQVEFNPQRVISYRQIGYAKHQLTKEQFRDNTVAAAPLAAREAGNALYTVEINPQGEGPVATVRVRFRIPGTTDVSEHEWQVPFDGTAPTLEKSSPAMRLAATASAFSEWLASSPFAQEVTTDRLLNYLNGVPAIYGADARPKQLETMIREAKSLSGK